MRRILLIGGLLLSSFAGGAFAQVMGGAINIAGAATNWFSYIAAISGSPTTNNGMLGQAFSTNQIWVNADNVDASGAPAGSQVVSGLSIEINPQGSSATGNVNALSSAVYVKAAIKPGQAAGTLNFVGVGALAQSNVNMGGGAGTELGAIFGMGPAVVAGPGATYLGNVTGGEVDTQVLATTGPPARKSGWSVAQLPTDSTQGSVYDAAYSASKQGGAVGWKNGLLFSDYNGGFPISAGGNFIASQGSQTLGNGVDFTSTTFTGSPYLAPLMTPASSAATCKQGAVEWDANFIYICAAANTWKRATLASF